MSLCAVYINYPFDSYNSILCKIPQKHLSVKETAELGAIKLETVCFAELFHL